MSTESVFTLCIMLITLISTVLGGAAWISSKMEKINNSIHQLSLDLKDKVSYDVCREKRSHCPCVKRVNQLISDLANNPSIKITPTPVD